MIRELKMICTDFQELLNKLNELHEDGNVLFRGLTNAEYHHQPGAFRKDEMRKYSDVYPYQRATIEQWISNAITQIQNHVSPAFASVPSYILRRIGNFLLDTLKYNFAIYESYNDKDFPQNCKDKRLTDIFMQGSDHHWAKERTFNTYFHSFFMSWIPLEDENKKIVKKSFVYEDVTGLDETYPQHYGFQTAALDWTYEPHIALFFTTYSDKTVNDTSYLSVSVYKEIKTDDSPIIIMSQDSLKNNPRADAQKGTFLYFRKPGSFYIEKGCFPCLEDYEQNLANSDKPKFFELHKFNLSRSKKNIKCIQEFLQEKQITESSLLLDPIC